MKKTILTFALFISVLISVTAQTWEEISKTLPEPYLQESSNHFYGYSVSISGEYAVVGAYGYDAWRGCAYVLHFTGTNWETQAKLTASDGFPEERFGCSVSMSGDIIVIGAKQDDDNGVYSGSAYIFEKPVSGWEDMTQTAKLTASDGSESDYFGNSVSISGDYIVVGAYYDDDNGQNSGSAYVFEKPVLGWNDMTQTAKLKASDGVSLDRFGNSVSISGDYVIVGANYDDDNGNNSGSAYVFEKPISGWVDMTQTAKLKASDGAVDDYFGYSVRISGDYIVIGAYYDDDKGNASGSAYIFEKPVSGWANMTQTAKLTAADGAEYDYFGETVNIDDNYVVIGARGDDDNGSDAGSAYIFEKPLEGWINATQTAKIYASDASSGDNFGISVSVDGEMLIVGAFYDGDNGNGSGSAYIYTKPLTGWENMTETEKTIAPPFYSNYLDYYGRSVSIDGDYAVVGAHGYKKFQGCAYVLHNIGSGWETQAKLTASDGFANEYFGASVSISGDQIAIGAYRDDSKGSAYIFEKPVSGWVDMTETAKLSASDGTNTDQLGISVCISGNSVVVGANADDDNGSNSGSAYVFEKPLTGWVNMTQIAKLKASDGAASDFFGVSVSISGDYIIVGSYNDDTKGSAYVFEKPVSGWANMNQTAKITASDGAVSDYFGYAVSISEDIVVIGAYGDDDNADYSGSAYIFEKPVTGWINTTETAKLLASDASLNNNFGYSACISGENIIIGAYNDNGSGSGSAYIFEKPPTGWVSATETKKLIASDGAADDNFGVSVSISGDNLVVGTVFDDDNGNQSGSAYFYEKSYPVLITQQPVSETVCETGTISFSIIASYVEYYQWQLSTDNGSVFSNIPETVPYSGVQSPTLSISSATYAMNQCQYRCILTNTGGETNSDTVILTVNPIYNETDSLAICEGENYTFGTQTLTEAGEYVEVFESISGCDSTVTLTLTVNPVYNETDAVSICSGEHYVFGTQTLTESGEYVEVFESISGCDSTVTLTLTVKPIYNETDSLAICEGENYTFGTQTLTESGEYVEVFESVSGCDSTVTLTLTVNPVYNETDAVSICSGENYIFGTQTLTESGEYVEVFESVTGCDSTVTLTLTVNPVYNETDAASICDGDSYSFGTQTLTTAGDYTELFESLSGCDSIVVLTLIVNSVYNEVDAVSICSGDNYVFGSQTLTESGEYVEVFESVTGCDSTVTLTFTVTPIYNETEAVSICEGDSYTFGTQILTSSGEYTEVFESVLGCDSTVILTLTINPVYNETDAISICDGETYNWRGLEYDISGTYTNDYTSITGCDSVFVLNLTMIDLPPTPIITQEGTSLTSNAVFGNQWYINDSEIEDATNQIYIATQEGEYFVMVTGENQCVSEPSNIITVTFTGINYLSDLQINIYPNPAKDKLFVENKHGNELQIEIYDLTGQLVKNEILTGVIHELDLSSLQSSIYLMKITIQSEERIVKIIKN